MTKGRRPTYGAATRVARLLLESLSRPYGWSFEAIQDELSISERTLERYLRACRTQLTHPDGRPIFEVVRRGDRRLLRLAGAADSTDAGVYQAVFLYFTLTVLTFLEGTVLKEGVEDLWERIERTLPHAQRLRLTNVTRQFHAAPFMAKDYRDCDEILDGVVRCLLDQRRIRVQYLKIDGTERTHEVDPYTLVAYRGGLYVIGHSRTSRHVLWLAVERMRSLERLPERFEYPKGYTPTKYTDGVFGIIEGPATYVELLLVNAETASLLSSRQISPTQKFRRRRDGTTVLSMTVKGTAELASWILSLSPFVKVLRPTSLRDEITERARETMRLYERSSR